MFFKLRITNTDKKKHYQKIKFVTICTMQLKNVQ